MIGPTSKFRHVKGVPARPDGCWTQIKPADTISDISNMIAANAKYVAFSWQAGGGGKLVVLPLDKPGKAPNELPFIAGHTGPLLDWAFHPFNENIIATGSEDSTAKIWAIPEGGLTSNIETPLTTLTGHGKRVGIVRFHHYANNVLITAGLDNLIKFWDIENGEKINIPLADAIWSLDLDLDGSSMVTTSKDKLIRTWDLRSRAPTGQVSGHAGAKTQKALWAKRRNKIITVGFSRSQERQLHLYDPRKLDTRLADIEIDNQNGVMMTEYDEDTNMLYLGGKGDSSIRYYELWENNPPLVALSDISNGVPQRGMCMLPKLAVDTALCEVSRFLKLEKDKIVPISFQCPRKQAAAELQTDVYPETFSPEPTVSAEEYFGGKFATPNLVAMQHGRFDRSGASPVAVKAAAFPASPASPASPTSPAAEVTVEQQRARVEALRKELEAEEKILQKLEEEFSA
eukprot:TRINITY_DN41696_c0_g1_i1.p1 TRINITY_DN41696_c0_g1~~TRINITY_DN41696_c0_g1_i1.p1  ORF type:complete len:458 (-),score=95.86 TRINITY_DN41696_c0_g1_i1:10-1383(-)